MPIPIEFNISGRPGSVNDPDTVGPWRDKVEKAAQFQKINKLGAASSALKSPLDTTVKIFFFPANRKYADVDNAIKPTIDGLKKALLTDDRQVMRVIAERFFPAVGASMKVPAEDVVTLGPILIAQANASRALLSAVVVQAGIPLMHPGGKAAKDASYATAVKVEPYVPNSGNFW